MLLMGPVGSGNSGNLPCFEIVRRASQQEPDENGIRRFALCDSAGNLVRQLSDTTIKTHFLIGFPGPCGVFRKTTKTYFF